LLKLIFILFIGVDWHFNKILMRWSLMSSYIVWMVLSAQEKTLMSL